MTEGRPTWTSGMPSFAVASATRQIARGRDLETRPEAESRHPGHHRDGRAADRIAYVVDGGDEGAGRFRGHVHHEPDVRPADEGALSRSAQHHDSQVVDRAGALDGRGEGVGVVLRHHVELRRVVVADRRDPAAVGVVAQVDMDVAHVSPPGIVKPGAGRAFDAAVRTRGC